MSVESFLLQKQSHESIQALEDCVLYYISYEELQRLYRDYPELNNIGRILTERCYVSAVQRITAMWMQKANDRFVWLAKQAPDLSQRVPAKYLASYMGITEGMLSNIKRRR